MQGVVCSNRTPRTIHSQETRLPSFDQATEDAFADKQEAELLAAMFPAVDVPENGIQAMIDRIHREGLVFSTGSSPHPYGEPVHTVYAAVSNSHYNLHNGKAEMVGRGFGNPTEVELALKRAYVQYHEYAKYRGDA